MGKVWKGKLTDRFGKRMKRQAGRKFQEVDERQANRQVWEKYEKAS